jgi:xanthine dehydrogenase large subunit
MPTRATKTETGLLGKPWSAETIQSVLPDFATEFAPISDVRGTAEYRSGLVTSLLEKFYAEAISIAPGFSPVSDGRKRETVSTVSGPREAVKTAETFLGRVNTGLKPGANENERVIPHESAHKHVTGAAMYVDDFPCGKNFLEVWPVCSPHAHAKILKRDATAARLMPGIQAVLLAEDIPGANDVGTKHDEPLLATNEVLFHRQLIALVVGDSLEACRAAAAKVVRGIRAARARSHAPRGHRERKLSQ